jgi:hypothetical protein
MLEFVSADRALACCAIPGAVVTVYRGPCTAAHAADVATIWRSEIIGAGMVHLLVLNPKGVRDAPDDGFRKGIAQLVKHPVRPMLGAVAVLPVSGFVGAAARGILTGIDWLTHDARQVCASVDEGAAWLCRTAPSLPLSTTMLTDHVASMQRLVR